MTYMLIASSEEELQQLVNRVHEAVGDMNMKINVKKTEVMKVSDDPSPTTVTVGSDTLAETKSFKYLGALFNSEASCVEEVKSWRIFCLRNSSSVPYFRLPPNLPTAARRNRKCTKCGTAAFGRNRMSASAHLSTFGDETETEAEIRSTSTLSGIIRLMSDDRHHGRGAASFLAVASDPASRTASSRNFSIRQ